VISGVPVFVKSLEEDFWTKTLDGESKVNFQSVLDMVGSRTIHPNTKSFGLEPRLSTTILSNTYLTTYRAQGIIFTTVKRPVYVLPFDLLLLSDAQRLAVHYHRLRQNLHFYYNRKLIPGFERFIFTSFSELVEKLPTLDDVWREINIFRRSAGFEELDTSKRRLILYNEAVFEESIAINPLAIFGDNKTARTIARECALPLFRSAKDFYRKNND
jgi:hypothetical protein